MVLGARGYLAPERLDGEDDAPSGDVYSLGICLYELLAGRHIVLSVHKDFHAEALEKHLATLRAAVQAAGIATLGEPVLARYNSPFSLPLFRRNEIMLEVAAPADR